MSLLEHCIVPGWAAPKKIRSLQTTRLGGSSINPYGSLNIGSHVGDSPLAVARNRILLNTILPSEPVWLEQVHGTTVVNADSTGCRPQADACIARHTASVCVVMTADCLPVLLCDIQGTVVAAVHAGWKGLAGGVIEATVRATDVNPQNLIAWLGPAISQNVFEVGDDVRDLFIETDSKAADAFISGESGKWFADIYRLARMRLNALGVDQISGGDYCTYQDSKQFYSYRRDGMTGRMGTFIWIE